MNNNASTCRWFPNENDQARMVDEICDEVEKRKKADHVTQHTNIPDGSQLFIPTGEWRPPEHGEYFCVFLGGLVYLHERNSGIDEPARHIMKRYVREGGEWRERP